MEAENIKGILEASYKPQAEASAQLHGMGYQYDPELSTMENKVFVDKEGKPHIAYRGSVRVKDWIGNAKLGLGFRDADAEKRIALAGKVKEKYKQAPTTYGHSRGGYIAERAGDIQGGKTYTFNKATVKSDIFKTLRPEQTDYRTTTDVVSLPSMFQKGKKFQTSSKGQSFLSAHSIDSFKFH